MTAHVEVRLGATLLTGNKCQFLVWAPRAKKVEVHLTDPDERFAPMHQDAPGYFRAIVDGVADGALYRYQLDDQKERPDPVSRLQPQGVHGPSQVVNHRFAWSDQSWTGLPLDRYVLYELHVGTFSREGTFGAIIPRIPKLKELGITAIECMPVAQFPGNRNWGYDGVYPYTVQASYGGPAGFQKFVNACHQQEMAVVLDVVYNHLGPEGNYLADFAPYFTNRYKTPWGEALNFDGPSSDDVRRYFIENALQWIDEFHVDGLRLDAIHAIVDPSARPFLQELGAAVHDKAAELGRKVYLFPESNLNDPRIVIPREANGMGLDAVWNDDFHHALHALLTGEHDGYYGDFCGINDFARAFRDGFVLSGQYSKYRGRRHGKPSKNIPAERIVVFTQNHDQIGNRRTGDRPVQTASLDKLKFAAGAMLLSPYIPLFFMGEEYGEVAPFQYFVSHGDADLIETVRNGRKKEFARFDWNGEIPDPQSEQTFLNSKLNWELQQVGTHRILWDFYRELLRLRQSEPALAQLDKNKMEVKCFEDQKLLCVTRETESTRVFFALHGDSFPSQFTLPLPAGRWKTLLDSADRKWGGKGSQTPEVLISPGEAEVSMCGWGVILFTQIGESD